MTCAPKLLQGTCLALVVHTFALCPGFAQYNLSDSGYDGFAIPAEDVMVAALEAGRLESLMVKVGDRVEAGQVVAKLDDTIQLFAVQSADVLASMRGTLDAAIADKEVHQWRLHQLRELSNKGIARPEEVNRAEAEFRVAEARWLSAKEEIMVREIDLKRAREQVRRRQIAAPISGVVAKIYRKPGEYVSPSDPAIVQVISVHQLIGEFNIPAADALRLELGQKVKVDAISLAITVVCEIESIAPLIDGESGTLAVRVRIDNSAGTLMPGDRCVMQPQPKTVRVSDRFPLREGFINPLRPLPGATTR